ARIQRCAERIAVEQRPRHGRPWNLAVPPDAGRVALDQFEQGMRHRVRFRTAGGASAAVCAPALVDAFRALAIAPETDLRGRPMRRAIGQRRCRNPVDLTGEGIRCGYRVIAAPRCVEVPCIALLLREAENVPWVDRMIAQRLPVTALDAVAGSVQPGLKFRKLTKACADGVVGAKS